MERPDRVRRIICLTLTLLLAPVALAAAPPDVLESARAAIRVKDYRRAVAVLQPAVNDGNADAQFLLASLQRSGLAAQTDPASVRQLLTAAANREHAPAAYSLAMILTHEEPRDPAQARQWLERAAKSGHRLAQAALTRGSLPLEFLPQRDLSETGARRAAFWRAVEQNDVALVSSLADRSLLDATDDFGRGVLSHAVQRGSAQVAEWLIANDARVEQADSFGVTPLMLAAAYADVETVDRLLQAQADANAADRVGNTALMFASGRDAPDAAIVRRLLKASTAASAVNTQGWSALDWAIAADAQAIVTLLREQGLTTRRRATIVVDAPAVPLRRAAGAMPDLYRGLADAEVAAARSSTTLLDAVLRAAPTTPLPASALRVATVAESVPTLQKVIESGAAGGDVRQQSEVLRWAVRHADPSVVKMLVSRGTLAAAAGEESPLSVAVRARRLDNARVLLDAQVSTDAVDATGMSALMLAAASGQTETVTELLQHLARVDLADKSGRNALWYASAAGASDAVDALLAARSPVNAADSVGQTPLAIAAARGHAQIVAALLRAGANGSTVSAAGATPLMFAASAGNVAVIRTLLGAGVPIDAQNRNGDTALIVAARHAQADAVRILLASGASDKLRNADRASALDVANALGLAEIEKLLTPG